MQAAGQPPSGRDISTAGRAQDMQVCSAWSTQAELRRAQSCKKMNQRGKATLAKLAAPPNLPLSRRLKDEAGDKVDGKDVDQLG